ncbi:hypothetical protein OROGR_017705 [Orobanche gracilis]
MVQKQFLHELLKEDQEPFLLKNYLADRRSQLKNTSPAADLQLRKRKPDIVRETSTSRSSILCKNACFFSFQNSPDVRKSPFFEFPSPVKSPCRSPTGAVFLHIPSRTAALLVEAAIRIQKQQQSKPKAHSAKNVGLGRLGSVLRRLKDRSKSKSRVIGDNHDFKVTGENATLLDKEDVEESIRISCCCSNRRLSSANWTENNEDKSSSSCGSECSNEITGDFCPSPFRFNLHQCPSSSGRRTPDFHSPAVSPSRRINQEKENYRSRNPVNVQGAEEDDEEQCSPVSVLDPVYEQDDCREAGDTDEDDHHHHLECTYENVQRAKQQLLYRLQRFEQLAELDPVELERNLLELEGSDDGDQGKREASDGDKPLSLYDKQIVETILSTQGSSPRCRSGIMSTDMRKLVSDLIVEEKSENVKPCDSEAVITGRVSNRLDSWREVESNTIDMMIGFDFKREFGQWTGFDEQAKEISAEIGVAIYGQLVEELSDDLLDMNSRR